MIAVAVAVRPEEGWRCSTGPSRNLVYSARGLARERSFTFTAVATLTVALALVTVVFAVFDAYVLRPYAVRDPYSLYEI